MNDHIRRYVWAYRDGLARRCHDMAKQLYNNKKYTPVVWLPLKEWLYTNRKVTTLRMTRLMSFNKEDDDLHVIVAKCLWNLANAPNLPWGRGAVRSAEYSRVPITEKVGTPNILQNEDIICLLLSLVFFFSIIICHVNI